MGRINIINGMIRKGTARSSKEEHLKKIARQYTESNAHVAKAEREIAKRAGNKKCQT